MMNKAQMRFNFSDSLYKKLKSYSAFSGKNSNLLEILDAKERRRLLQQECLKKHSCCLISMSIISPGEIKKNILLDYVFNLLLDYIYKYIENNQLKINYKYIEDKISGYYSLFSIEANANEVKKDMIKIENSLGIARLWDIDIIDSQSKILSRTQMGYHPRKCLICNDNAKICARKKEHNIEELNKKIQEIVLNDFFNRKISFLVYQSLIKEVNLTPKPGLVDKNNNGAHMDMNLEIFHKSADVISSFNVEFIEKGINLSKEKSSKILPQIRPIGKKAEEAMFLATKGVNTHKGIIFSFGLICTSIGILIGRSSQITIENICNSVIEISKDLLKELENISTPKTAGEKLYLKYKIKGARGEAISGFKIIRDHSLPTYYKYKHLGEDKALLISMLSLIANNQDTNIINRAGINGLKWSKNKAKEILDDPSIYDNNILITRLKTFDQQAIEKNISPGGSADLLAITYFFIKILEIYKQ